MCYDKSELLFPSLYYGFFKRPFNTGNLIKNKMIKSRSLVQICFIRDNIECKAEFVVIDTTSCPAERMIFNPIGDKDYRFQYWLWDIEKNGRKVKFFRTHFNNRKDLEEYLEKTTKPNIIDRALILLKKFKQVLRNFTL